MSRGTGDKLAGKANELEGRLKQAVAHVTGDDNLHADGAIDKAKGKAKAIRGAVKDMAERSDDRLEASLERRKRKTD